MTVALRDEFDISIASVRYYVPLEEVERVLCGKWGSGVAIPSIFDDGGGNMSKSLRESSNTNDVDNDRTDHKKRGVVGSQSTLDIYADDLHQ